MSRKQIGSLAYMQLEEFIMMVEEILSGNNRRRLHFDRKSNSEFRTRPLKIKYVVKLLRYMLKAKPSGLDTPCFTVYKVVY